MKNRLLKALARDGRVRIYVCDTTQLVQEAKDRHDLFPTASAALGRLLSVGVMMGSNLKSEKEKLSITVNGGGPIGTMMCDAYSDGSVRGFVGDPHVHFEYNDTHKLAVGIAVGNQGYLEVRKDLGLKEDFGGKVELINGEIGDDFSYYFYASEQTPSIVSVGVLVDTDNNIMSSGGLLIQMMPDATEEDLVASEELAKRLRPMSELIHEGTSLEDILYDLYDDVRILEEREVGFKCNCSRDRMKAALTTVDINDLREMKEQDHGCELTCHFCGDSYTFNEEDLETIIRFKENFHVAH